MKFDDIQKLIHLAPADPVEAQQKLHSLLLTLGIEPNNLYQELEMSSESVNTHRDTSYSNATISLHSHNYYEIIYCRTTANVEYLVGSQRYKLQKGDIVCVPPGISHRPILPEHMEQPYSRDVLWIDDRFWKNVEYTISNSVPLDSESNTLIRTGGTKWEFLGDMFHRGVQEELEKRPGWEAAVIGNTLMILANLKRAGLEQNAKPLTAEKPELLDRITAYIETNYTYPITIQDLARRFYVSESTVSHLFKQKMGVSIYRYIIQRRLITAKTLIQQGRLMEDVSREVGFSDYSSFYRAFKQEFGISPRQFGQL